MVRRFFYGSASIRGKRPPGDQESAVGGGPSFLASEPLFFAPTELADRVDPAKTPGESL